MGICGYIAKSAKAVAKIFGINFLSNAAATTVSYVGDEVGFPKPVTLVLSVAVDGIFSVVLGKHLIKPGVGSANGGGSKTIDDIIDNLPETTNGKGVARNFESTGGFDQTIKDFDALNPIDVKEIHTQYGPGKVGKLSDGTTVVARPGSTTGGATLEIRVSNSKVYKIRY